MNRKGLIRRFDYHESKFSLIIGLLGIYSATGFMILSPFLILKIIFGAFALTSSWLIFKKIKQKPFEITVWEDSLLLPAGGINQWNSVGIEVKYDEIKSLKLDKTFKFGPIIFIETNEKVFYLNPRKLNLNDIPDLYNLIAAKKGYKLFETAVSEDLKSQL